MDTAERWCLHRSNIFVSCKTGHDKKTRILRRHVSLENIDYLHTILGVHTTCCELWDDLDIYGPLSYPSKMLPIDDEGMAGVTEPAACCQECRRRSDEGCAAFVLDLNFGCWFRSQVIVHKASRPLVVGLVDDGLCLMFFCMAK